MKTIYIIPILIVSIIGTLIPAILFAFAQILLGALVNTVWFGVFSVKEN